MTETLLQAVDLRCERDDRVLFDRLSLDIAEGTLLRVEGPNGSGKTTLLRMLAGLSEPQEGRLLWRGEAFRGSVLPVFHGNLLFLGHKPGLKAMLSPLENLRAFQSPRDSDADSTLLYQALEKVGLGGFEDFPCRQLSAGQQRRAALARLYLSRAPLWILDEAFTAVDQDGVRALEALLAARARQGGAVVFTTHHRLELPGLQRLVLGAGAMAMTGAQYAPEVRA